MELGMTHKTEQNLCSGKVKRSTKETTVMTVPLSSKRQNWEEALLSAFLYFMYFRVSHIHYIFGPFCLKLPIVRLVSFNERDFKAYFDGVSILVKMQVLRQ